MKYFTHQTISILTAYGIDSLILNTPDKAFFYLSTAVGALIPDIDHTNSRINRYNPLSPLTSKLKHRGFTHSLLAAVIFFILVRLLFSSYPSIYLGLTIGYLGHLIGDFLTKQGIPFLYPSRKRYKFLITITTGSIGEYLIFILSLSLLTYFILIK